MKDIIPPPARQVLLRLPEDVAARLARAVPPRRRNQFLIDLVRRELAKEDEALVAACEAMNRLEASTPSLQAEAAEWLDAPLAPANDAVDEHFDADTFALEAAKAQTAPAARKRRTSPRR